MSNQNNTDLLERAHEAIEFTLGTTREKELYRAIEDGDLKELERLVTEVENYAIETAQNYDLIPHTDTMEYGDVN